MENMNHGELFSKALAKRIRDYVRTNIYPMHMPGHKRNLPLPIQHSLRHIWELDLTEVEGSDSLHHANGIIKEAQDFAAEIYGAKRSFFLVNGSSCGILAAIHACVDSKKKKIIMVRESHMSAYNAVELYHLEPILVSSYLAKGRGSEEEGIQLYAGVNTELLCEAIKEHYREACAVFITSPTYEGFVSDIVRIAEFAHRHHLPLIVDEAHGAHLQFTKECNNISSAINLGADVVIQSVHKTLPSFTQTAILHISHSSLADSENVGASLRIFESSSPSYILMSSIDSAIRYMAGAKQEIRLLFQMQQELYEKCKALKYIKLVQKHTICTQDNRESDVLSLQRDELKLLIYSEKLSGVELADILRKQYCIEPEMAAQDYVLCMLTIGDTKEGIEKLYRALCDMNERLEKEVPCGKKSCFGTDLEKLCGMRAKQPIYAFPPDIPIVRRGEEITKAHIQIIENALCKGLKIYGLEDYGKDIYIDGKEFFG